MLLHWMEVEIIGIVLLEIHLRMQSGIVSVEGLCSRIVVVVVVVVDTVSLHNNPHNRTFVLVAAAAIALVGS